MAYGWSHELGCSWEGRARRRQLLALIRNVVLFPLLTNINSVARNAVLTESPCWYSSRGAVYFLAYRSGWLVPPAPWPPVLSCHHVSTLHPLSCTLCTSSSVTTLLIILRLCKILGKTTDQRCHSLVSPWNALLGRRTTAICNLLMHSKTPHTVKKYRLWNHGLGAHFIFRQKMLWVVTVTMWNLHLSPFLDTPPLVQLIFQRSWKVCRL